MCPASRPAWTRRRTLLLGLGGAVVAAAGGTATAAELVARGVAEKYPHLISAVAAISPAVWTSYGQARTANRGAYSSAADFAAYDAVTHAHALRGIPVRIASGNSDPFHPGVAALARALPPGSVVDFSQGCHTGPFFVEQEPRSLEFLARHLTT